MIREEFFEHVELYKRGLFDFIEFPDPDQNDFTFKFHAKQLQFLEYWSDNQTTELGFGGAARGGKSAMLTLVPLYESYVYPGIRTLIGRKNLKQLNRTTGKTLKKFMRIYGFVEDEDYTHNSRDNEYRFGGIGSEILFQNLQLQPSDPDADEFGSLEITRAIIDQSENVNIKIINKMKERVGSYLNHKYDILGKVAEAFNPSPTHVKSRYWVPFRDKKETKTKKFVRSLPADNPSPAAQKWLKQKEKDYRSGSMGEVDYQRHIRGNFDWDDNKLALLRFNHINDLFHNRHVEYGDTYGVADVAGKGKDDYLLTAWEGWVMVDFEIHKKNDGKEAKEICEAFMEKNAITNSNMCFDAVGLGFALSGYFPGAIEFKSGNKAPDDDYYHVRDQCGYDLAEKIKAGEMWINCDLELTVKNQIQLELGQLIEFISGTTHKKRILPKKKIKENIGCSPNWMDVLLMRMAWDLKGMEENHSWDDYDVVTV